MEVGVVVFGQVLLGDGAHAEPGHPFQLVGPGTGQRLQRVAEWSTVTGFILHTGALVAD